MKPGIEESITGTVLEIQRMSTEDGPGLRTTVFMKGCPMKCLWCHNPESISHQPQVQWIGMRCIGCKSCIKICPQHALAMDQEQLHINRNLCDGCGLCAEECPSTALELLGKRWEVQDLAKELLKDREYFKTSKGGVTISGGEATLQWKFVATLAQILKKEGIHICIDTCGITRQEALEAILPFTDIILFDLKEMDAGLHRQYTQSNLSQVLASLSFITGYIQDHQVPIDVWIRTPLIPGATARDENVFRIGEEISRRGNGTVTRWDLLSFNNLCKDKYLRLGLDWPLKTAELLTAETMEHLASVAKRSGANPEIVYWSGSTRINEDESGKFMQPRQENAPGC